MDALSIFAIIAGVIGIVGSIVPGLPGPPISWLGILLLYFSQSADPISLTTLFVWLAVTVIVTILDYVVPAALTKATGGSKYAATGAIVGLFAGMLLTPIGMITGSLLGAFLAEFLIADKGVWKSFTASLGAFLGFICGTGLKLICSGWMFYIILKAL